MEELKSLITELETLLSPYKFQEWLSNKEPQEIVGTTLSSESCPIAKFLMEKCASKGVIRASVGYHIISIETNSNANIFYCQYEWGVYSYGQAESIKLIKDVSWIENIARKVDRLQKVEVSAVDVLVIVDAYLGVTN